MVEPTDVLWRRMGAALVDVALVLAVSLLAWWLLPSVLAVIVAIAAAAGSWVLLQGRTGATPGKHLLGLRVVDADGRLCDERAALLRTAFWVVDGFPYVLPLTGYAAAFGDRNGQRFGDRAAHTYVVDRRFVGHPPFSVAVAGDGPARLLTTRAAYRQGWTNPVVRTGGYAGATPGTPAPADRPATGTSVDVAEPPVADEVPPVADEVGPATAAALDPALGPPLALGSGTDATYDPEAGGFLRWDEIHQSWAIFDEATRQWRTVASNRPRPVER